MKTHLDQLISVIFLHQQDVALKEEVLTSTRLEMKIFFEKRLRTVM